MKKFISVFLILSIGIGLIFYSLFSFVKWDCNPEHWAQETRGVFAFIMLGCVAISAIISVGYVEINNNKQK